MKKEKISFEITLISFKPMLNSTIFLLVPFCQCFIQGRIKKGNKTVFEDFLHNLHNSVPIQEERDFFQEFNYSYVLLSTVQKHISTFLSLFSQHNIAEVPLLQERVRSPQKRRQENQRHCILEKHYSLLNLHCAVFPNTPFPNCKIFHGILWPRDEYGWEN